MIRVRNSVKKIKTNLAGANSSIQRRQTHIGELKTLVKTQHGLAKKELNKVLQKSQTLLEKIQSYAKEGSAVLEDKQKIVTEEENRIKKEKEEVEKK